MTPVFNVTLQLFKSYQFNFKTFWFWLDCLNIITIQIYFIVLHCSSKKKKSMAQLICDVTCGLRFSSSTSLTIPRWELRAFSMGVWIGFTAQALNNIHCFIKVIYT